MEHFVECKDLLIVEKDPFSASPLVSLVDGYSFRLSGTSILHRTLNRVAQSRATLWLYGYGSLETHIEIVKNTYDDNDDEPRVISSEVIDADFKQENYFKWRYPRL
jgi:hypothetical protein